MPGRGRHSRMKDVGKYVVVMAVVIAVSNVLVQYPIGEWLTWAALTYPLAFVVTDVTNRMKGAAAARKVVISGFVVGIIASVIASFFDLTTMRVALASATAFLVAQLLDVSIFDRFRELTWWKTPMISSTIASTIDTLIFFSLAFSTFTFAFLPDMNDWALETVPIFGFGPDAPLWLSLAIGDLLVKIVLIPLLLIPYRYYIRHSFGSLSGLRK